MQIKLIIALAASLLSPVAATASVLLDQENITTVTTDGVYSGLLGTGIDYRQAQIVRAGRTGTLSRIDLQVRNRSVTATGLTLQLVYASTFVDLPTVPGPGVAVTGLTTGTSGQIVSVDVSSLNFAVTPGQKFAILLRAETPSDNNRFGWLFGQVDPADSNNTLIRSYGCCFNNLYNVYGPGIWGTSGADRGFATYVDVTSSVVPEPASWALLIAGFGLTGAAMRRRKVAIA